MSEVKFTQALPIRVYEWLQENGYSPAFYRDGNGWREMLFVSSTHTSIGVIHGRKLPWWKFQHRRVVGNITLPPWSFVRCDKCAIGAPDTWTVGIFGTDAAAALFKRNLESLQVRFEADILAVHTTTENILTW